MNFYNPDQYTEPQSGLEPSIPASPKSSVAVIKAYNPTAEQEAVIAQVADWIDADVIAGVIAEELVDGGLPVTVENCQKVWLRVLEDLYHQVGYAITDEL